MAQPERGAPSRTGDISVFDRLSPLYDQLRPATDPSTLAPGLARAEREIERVLDVGGGSGQGVRALDVREGIVADAAPGMLRRAKRHGLGAVAADASRLPFAAESVDAVIVLDALHHMANPESVVAEAARVIRPGGVLVIQEFDPTRLLGRALVAGEHLLGMDSVFFAPGDLEAMVRGAGLAATIPRTGFEYLVAGVKPR
ncbi:class I SAM-dependent methyltransferase [Halorientalis brevis]|uniref:Class I SAM-dependent methyltransferase n=1 Tax=Halorientalis brevis TaxID=1126241 RepID=A0ABD6CCU1_9EURY|nr:class I SAM-dependent methyltransferase [Halorientalis brevis]